MAEPPLLSVRDLEGWYGDSHVLHRMNFDVREGEVATLLGRNGAGKTTTLKAIMGMLAKRAGAVCFAGRETIGLSSDRIARLGVAICPEERGGPAGAVSMCRADAAIGQADRAIVEAERDAGRYRDPRFLQEEARQIDAVAQNTAVRQAQAPQRVEMDEKGMAGARHERQVKDIGGQARIHRLHKVADHPGAPAALDDVRADEGVTVLHGGERDRPRKIRHGR